MLLFSSLILFFSLSTISLFVWIKIGVSRNNIFKEDMSLYHFLDVLNIKIPDQIQRGDIWFKTLKSFKTPDDPLKQVKLLLDRLMMKLKSGKVFKKFEQALFWPFQKGEIKEILDNIECQKSIIDLALENDHM